MTKITLTRPVIVRSTGQTSTGAPIIREIRLKKGVNDLSDLTPEQLAAVENDYVVKGALPQLKPGAPERSNKPTVTERPQPGTRERGPKVKPAGADGGPTVEEYAAAGYDVATYPPKPYASKSTAAEISAAAEAQKAAGGPTKTAD